MDAKGRAKLAWNASVLLTFAAGVMLIAGCGADPGTGPASSNALDPLGATAGATDAKAPAQGQPDPDSGPADGDTQTGEFEGEHQFGDNNEAEDHTDDDVEDGPNDEVEDEQDDAGEGSELKAVLSDGTVRAVVEYEQEADHTSFEVEVSGGQPDATLNVAVNGVVVLSITLDSTGAGELEFSSSPDDADEQLLPAEFPVLSAGNVVAVGDLSGPLEAEQED